MEVLVVDDHPLIREIMPAVLRRAFGEVSVVGVGDLEAAFQRLAHHKAPDLTLLDLELPGHHGLETLRRFRWKFPDVPVAVASLEWLAAPPARGSAARWRGMARLPRP